MKRITLLTAILLVAVSSQAQEPKKSVLIVETGKPTPTVVKTADHIKVNYRVRWYNLPQMGQNGEVIIHEEYMQPESLPVGDFEAIALDVGSRGQDGNEYYKDFTYTFRIINKEKSSDQTQYAIPSLKFFWSIKKAGETDESQQEQLEFETDPIPIRYVSTVNEGDELYIRDEFYFPEYNSRSLFLRILPIVMVIGSFAWLVSGLAAPKIQNMMKKEKASESEEARLSLVLARMKFYRLLTKLEGGQKPYIFHLGRPNTVLIARNLYTACQNIVLAELPGVNRSHTARDVSIYISNNLIPGKSRDALNAFVRRMSIYAKIIDGVDTGELKDRDAVVNEAKYLRRYANSLVWYKKLWAKLTSWKR